MREITRISIAQYPGKKWRLVPYAANYFRKHPCQVLIEPFAGSGVVGLSLLHAGIIQRLVLVEKDERMVRLHKGVLDDPKLADRYAAFDCKLENVKRLFRREKSAFRYLVQSRVCHYGKFSGGLRAGVDGRWCRQLVVVNLRRVYQMRERITIVHGDGLRVMLQHVGQENVGCFADPPYSSDPTSKGHTVYRHHRLNHRRLFSLLAAWRGPWLLTEDNCRTVRRLALCYRFACRRVVMPTSHNVKKTELVLWRKRRVF